MNSLVKKLQQYKQRSYQFIEKIPRSLFKFFEMSGGQTLVIYMTYSKIYALKYNSPSNTALQK